MLRNAHSLFLLLPRKNCVLYHKNKVYIRTHIVNQLTPLPCQDFFFAVIMTINNGWSADAQLRQQVAVHFSDRVCEWFLIF